MCVANIRGRVENRSTSKPASRNKMGRVQTWLSEKVAVVISVLDSRGSTGIMAERDSAPGRSTLRRLCPRRGSGWSCARWTGRPAAAAEAARWRAPRPPTRGVPTAPGCSSRRASAPRPDRCPACRSHCPTAASLSPAHIHGPRTAVLPGAETGQTEGLDVQYNSARHRCQILSHRASIKNVVCPVSK